MQIKYSYQEWWRDWPKETRQPDVFTLTVLIPAGLIPGR